jgi:hypothetical protein
MQWSASCPSWFTPGTCSTQSCMDDRATLGTTEKWKLFVPAKNKTPIPQFPSLWPSNYTELYQLLEQPAASTYPWWQRPNILLQCWCSNNRLYLTSRNTTFSSSSSLWLKISHTSNKWLAVTSSSWSSEHHPNHLCNHLHNIELQCKPHKEFSTKLPVMNSKLQHFDILIYQQGAVCWESYTFLYIPL